MSHHIEIETPQMEVAGGPEPWVRKAAFSTMLMGLFVAISALLSGVTAHHSLVGRTEEVMEISKIEGDRLHIEILKTKHATLNSLGQKIAPVELAKVQKFENDANALEENLAKLKAGLSATHHLHLIFGIAATILSVSICLTGMSVIAKAKPAWYVALCFSTIGLTTSIYGIIEFACS